MSTIAILYHVTEPESAEAILRDGFIDAAGSYMNNEGKTFEGVWLSDNPDAWIDVIAVQRKCPNPYVLAVTMDSYLQSMLNNYEWSQQDVPHDYREWLIPAKLINEHSSVRIESGKKILSGGQTGVDRAALDVALELGIACGGWCPQGRLAEDGVIPSKYPLEETPSAEYHKHTGTNVAFSDGVLILTLGVPTDGTVLTADYARMFQKPYLVVDLAQPVDIASVKEWIASNHINILNVAGPRASNHPDIYDRAKEVLRKVLA